jgi:hypothetical protein
MRPISKAEVRASVHRTVVSRLVLVGAVVGGVVIACLARAVQGGFDGQPSSVASAPLAVLGMLSTAALSTVALRGSRTRPDARAVVFRAVVAAVMNVPACVTLHGAWEWLISPGPTAFAASFVLLFPLGLGVFTFVAMLVSVPLGAAYGAVHVAALHVMQRELAQPSWRAFSRARQIAIAIDVIGACVIAWMTSLESALAELLVVPLGALVVLVAIDVGQLLVGWARMHRWVARIHSDTSMRVVAPTHARVSSALAPLAPISGDALAVVSARLALPYRDRPWAFALMPR